MPSASNKPRVTFQAEQRVERSEAYIFGGLALLVTLLPTILFAKLPGSEPVSVYVMAYAPALLIFAHAINTYRRRGKLVFRVVGDEQQFVMMRRWLSASFHEDVTIRFSELTAVAYNDRDDEPARTAFFLAPGCIECLGMELVDHGPLLAYIRRQFDGKMSYNGKTITTPKEIPQQSRTKRTMRAGRRPRKRKS